MCKVRVLHLSDLHLTNNQKDIPLAQIRAFKRELIKAIKDIKRIDGIDIVSVTGDIINKGRVNEYGFVKDFFREVSKEVQIPLEKFVFAPGNHDAQRDKSVRSLDIYDMEDYMSFRNHFAGRFSNFCEFYKDLTNDNTSISSKGYGIKDFEIEEKTIRFVVFNSSLCTNDEHDFMNLVISKYQFEDIEKEIIKTEKKPILTIALMHHPIQWLSIDEQDELLRYFEDEFNINILLHGHTHEGRIYGNMDIDRTLINFVTGIGYDKSEKGRYKSLKYRMAYYQFDTDKDEINGKLFVTNDKLSFIPDTSRYRKININGSFSINYPLKNIDYTNLYEQYTSLATSEDIETNINLKEKISLLERLIYDGKKYLLNDAYIYFNTQEKKYELRFVKKYEIIGEEPLWYSGQFYSNKYKNSPHESKSFYDKNHIDWEDLKFRAYVKVLNAKNKVIQNRVEVLVECVAESSNYKTFNIKYINKRLNTHLDVQKGNIIELEYSYEVPINYWGSYLNRTISYFNEVGNINISCDDKEKLNNQDLVLTKAPKTQISDYNDFILQENGSYRISIPRASGKYTLYWDAQKIFGIDDDNTVPSRDECQITNT